MANSKDPDEMPHRAAFHQGLHCLLRQNQYLDEEMFCVFFVEIITCNPSILYTMDHPDFTVSNFVENSTDLKEAKSATMNIFRKKIFSF